MDKVKEIIKDRKKLIFAGVATIVGYSLIKLFWPSKD
jgi:hypothetical protein